MFVPLIPYALLSVCVFIIDRLLKVWSYDALRLMQGGSRPLIPNVLHLTYAENTGISFNFFAGNRMMILLVSGAIILVILVTLVLTQKPRTLFQPMGWMIVGAAFGNLYDRWAHGFVIDLFEIRLFRFAIFNFADAVITVCSVIIVIVVLAWPAKNKVRQY